MHEGSLLHKETLLLEDHFCTRGHYCMATLLHEGSILQERIFLHGDTFAQRLFCTQGHFCMRWHFCMASLLHEVTLLHGDSFARRVTFARGDTFARQLFCSRGHFRTETFCTIKISVTFFQCDILARWLFSTEHLFAWFKFFSQYRIFICKENWKLKFYNRLISKTKIKKITKNRKNYSKIQNKATR